MSFIFAKTILDLRREPVRPAQALIEDPLQETQLLPGEEIAVIEEKGEWAYIEALEQPCFRNGWAGYKGWVERDGLGRGAAKPSWVVAGHGANVSFGSKVSEKLEGCRDLGESVQNPREFLIEAALSFKGMPYQWGGRSSYIPRERLISSVDCSGLVSLCFLAMGCIVPRDAHDQWLKARAIEPAGLGVGDLIFTAKASRPERVTHVMLYKGNNILIEAASAVGKVHEVSVDEKLGCSLGDLRNGDVVGDKVIFTGSFL